VVCGRGRAIDQIRGQKVYFFLVGVQLVLNLFFLIIFANSHIVLSLWGPFVCVCVYVLLLLLLLLLQWYFVSY
jgi:hypothetical protein